MAPRTPRRQRVFVLIGIVLVVTLLVPVTRRWWVAVWSVAVRPVTSGLQIVHQHWAWPWESGSLARQRDQAVQQNEQLLVAVTTLQAQLETVKAAQELSHLVTSIQRTAVIGTVIGYSPDPGIQSITINRGSKDGVLEGQAALSPEGVVIGKVHDVSSSTSAIILLADSHSTILARVNNAAHSPGLVKGQQGIGLQMELLPRNDKIVVGDTVVTSGGEDRIPMNLPIGAVTEVSTRQGDVFQNAVLSNSVVAFRLTAVAVILR
jgi:rod shape-determining protein MreC